MLNSSQLGIYFQLTFVVALFGLVFFCPILVPAINRVTEIFGTISLSVVINAERALNGASFNYFYLKLSRVDRIRENSDRLPIYETHEEDFFACR